MGLPCCILVNPPTLKARNSLLLLSAFLVFLADMLQLINTEDSDFPGLFDAPFSASTAPDPNPHGPTLFDDYLGASTPSSSSLFQLPAPPSFLPPPVASPEGTASPMDIKEEPLVATLSQPQVQLPLARMTTQNQNFIPAPPTSFLPQPLRGFPNQSSVTGEDGGDRCTPAGRRCPLPELGERNGHLIGEKSKAQVLGDKVTQILSVRRCAARQLEVMVGTQVGDLVSNG